MNYFGLTLWARFTKQYKLTCNGKNDTNGLNLEIQMQQDLLNKGKHNIPKAA